MKASTHTITKAFALMAMLVVAAIAAPGAGATSGTAVLDPWAAGLIRQQAGALDPWAVGLVEQSHREAEPVDSRDYVAVDPWAVTLIQQQPQALDPWAVGLVQRSPQAVPVDSRDLLPASRGAEPTVIATTPSASPGFDYTDAGIGAAATLVAVLLVGVPAVMFRRHGSTQPAAL